MISPFAKTNYISHQPMDFVSILRFIQYNWALGPLPARRSLRANSKAETFAIC